MGVTYRVDPGPEFNRVVAALARIDSSMPKNFKAEVTKEAEVLASKAKNKVRSLPTHGKKHTGMRGRIASGVGVKVGGTAFARITTSMDDPEERTMPRNFDDRSGWRHPLFGDRDVWVDQNSGGSWFMETMQDGQAPLERALTNVIENAAEIVAAAGGHI